MIIIFCPETDKCTWHVCQIRVVEEIEGRDTTDSTVHYFTKDIHVHVHD